MKIKSPFLFVFFLFLALISPAWGDAIQLLDGRFLDDVTLNEAEGGVTIVFKNGEVFIPEKMVREVYKLEPTGAYKPKNEQERERLEKGFVPFEGRWIGRTLRESILAKRKEEALKRMEEAKAHQLWRNRYKAESAHFRFEYTVTPEVFENLKNLFEAFYAEFTRKMGVKLSLQGGKLLVCLYSDREKFHQVSGAPYGALGYFKFVDPVELNIFYERRDPRQTIDVLFHETNHYLTFLIDPKFRYPDWINESLAEYYGASQWDPEKKKMTVGHVQEGRLVVLQDAMIGEEWMGLEEMIRTENFSALHYAWGWSFAHFLIHTPKYSKRFLKFYPALAKDRQLKRRLWAFNMKEVPVDDQIEALKKYLGVKDLKDLEKEWHEYIKTKLELKTHRGFGEAGKWAMRNGMPIKAEKFFKTAIEKGTTDPTTFHQYAMLIQGQENRNKEAIPILEQAIQCDPLNAEYYFDLGRIYEKLGGDENKEKGIRLVKLALEIDPDNPDIAMDIEIEKKMEDEEEEEKKDSSRF